MKYNFLGKEIKSPTVLASGILGNNFDILNEVYDSGAGIVTMKSIGPAPRDGHNNPTVIEFGEGLINAVGLPSPGYKNMEHEWHELDKRIFPLVASVYGGSVDEYVKVAKFVASKNPEFIEINISCPNSKSHGQIFGTSCESSFEVVSKVRKAIGNTKLIVKLTPQAVNIGEIAHMCEKAGADAICAINTLGPGMIIDIDARKPVLAFKRGGLSGPAIKPVAVRCVYDIFQNVKIPIIGLGGITNGKDAIEIIMAGASIVGMGSSVFYRGMKVFSKVTREIEEWLKDNNITDIKKIVGAAH